MSSKITRIRYTHSSMRIKISNKEHFCLCHDCATKYTTYVTMDRQYREVYILRKKQLCSVCSTRLRWLKQKANLLKPIYCEHVRIWRRYQFKVRCLNNKRIIDLSNEESDSDNDYALTDSAEGVPRRVRYPETTDTSVDVLKTKPIDIFRDSDSD